MNVRAVHLGLFPVSPLAGTDLRRDDHKASPLHGHDLAQFQVRVSARVVRPARPRVVVVEGWPARRVDLDPLRVLGVP